MFKIFLFLTTLSFLQVHQAKTASILSCDLAVSPFDNVTCDSDKPIRITPVSVTYLVNRDGKQFQLKVKPLSKLEKENYEEEKKKLLDEHRKEVEEILKLPIKDEQETQPKIKKEIVSADKLEKLKQIEIDNDPSVNPKKTDKLKINVDDQIDKSKEIELENIKKKQEDSKGKTEDQKLQDEVKDEISQNEYVENMSFVNSPFIAAQIPKKVIVELNEAKVLMNLHEMRHFQKLYSVQIFAGYKILMLEHFENGTLREFIMDDLARPEDQRYFKDEIIKMNFFDKLAKIVVDLHALNYIHTNLSPDTIFVNKQMEPVIGGFEFVHESGSMSQLDPTFFTTEGDYEFTSSIDGLDFKELMDLGDVKKDKGEQIVKSNIKIKSDPEDEHKTNEHQTTKSNPEVTLEIDLKFTRSLEYIAPELILPESNRTFYFNNKLDTYSLGAIYYFMLFGKAPFQGKTRQELIDNLGLRFVTILPGTYNNSISIFETSLSLIPDGRTSTYYLSIQIGMELARDFKQQLTQTIKISTDFEYTNKYGRDFFDKYSEMIFVLIMAFVIIPLTVFLASYKFKVENQNIVNRDNEGEVEQNGGVDMNQVVALNNRHA